MNGSNNEFNLLGLAKNYFLFVVAGHYHSNSQSNVDQ